MLDFTINTYINLLSALLKKHYIFQTYADFFVSPASRCIILRHDVDKLPVNSLRIAQLENGFGLTGTYYFRSVPFSFNEKIIKKIGSMGHEIGYHYEDLALANGDMTMAYESFCRNLERLRKLEPVRTITMHGSPRSKWDNRIIWDHYNYRDFGLIAEPYFDTNFNEVAYFSDTGRQWDDPSIRVRDKVKSTFNFTFHSTRDIIDNIDKLPDKIMMTFHPQRWSNNPIIWTRELLLQKMKNEVKRVIVRRGERTAS